MGSPRCTRGRGTLASAASSGSSANQRGLGIHSSLSVVVAVIWQRIETLCFRSVLSCSGRFTWSPYLCQTGASSFFLVYLSALEKLFICLVCLAIIAYPCTL